MPTVNGISVQSNEENALPQYLKLFIMLYADDTIILAETANDLQNALDAYNSYCTNWKLTINTTKSKIVVFSKGRPSNFNFTLNNQPLETVNEYKYLGVLFSRTGSFYKNKKTCCSSGKRSYI